MALTRKKAVAMMKKMPGMAWDATKAIVLFLWEIIKNPLVLKDKLAVAQHHLKEVGLVIRADGCITGTIWEVPCVVSYTEIAKSSCLSSSQARKSSQFFPCRLLYSGACPSMPVVHASHFFHLAFGPQFGRHYWLGLKLLWGDIKTAKKIIKRILRGFPMTRRERKQLLRTASDIFRMVPLAVSRVQVWCGVENSGSPLGRVRRAKRPLATSFCAAFVASRPLFYLVRIQACSTTKCAKLLSPLVDSNA